MEPMTYLEGYMGGSPGGDHAFTSSIMAFDTSIDAVAYLYTYGDKDAERSYVGLKTQSGTVLRLDGMGVVHTGRLNSIHISEQRKPDLHS